MKVSVKDLRRIIKEELSQLDEAAALENNALKTGFTTLVNAFPNVLNNAIVNEKMGGASADNRTRQAMGEQAHEHVNASSKKFEQALQGLIEKHFSDAVSSFTAPTTPVAKPAPRPSTGPNPDQRATIVPPAMG